MHCSTVEGRASDLSVHHTIPAPTPTQDHGYNAMADAVSSNPRCYPTLFGSPPQNDQSFDAALGLTVPPEDVGKASTQMTNQVTPH